MLFRPRIFVSSTFLENADVRKDIEDILQKSGSEPLLYETTLTPSVLPRTYRQNVLDSDFVLLILKEKYGSKTDSGLSGTHEEYKIAKLNKKPMHVYLYKPEEDGKSLKKSKDKFDSDSKKENPDLQKFLDELNNDGVSYYFYKSNEDLLSRIQATIFTIAKEIMIYSIESIELPDNNVAKISSNKDYSKAIEIFKIINKALDYSSFGEIDFVSTTLFLDMHELIDFDFAKNKSVFIDSKLDDEFKKIHEFGKSIALDICNSSIRDNWRCKIILGKEDSNLFASKYNDSNDIERITKNIHEYFKKYNKFKSLVQQHKIFKDISC